MDTLTFLQHYWWFIISLLGALLVFLLFVQGGQALLYRIGHTDEERNLIVHSLGRKWELTFTTLVTFGGAFFASFPLFYSTSFGGAVYVWMAILLCFVVQAVAYEYRRKPGNVFGERTFNAFLLVNGVLGPLLIGTAVGTFFTGAEFTVDRLNLANQGGAAVISQWATPWHGLEAVAHVRQRAADNDRHGILHVAGFHFMHQLRGHDRLIRESDVLRLVVLFMMCQGFSSLNWFAAYLKGFLLCYCGERSVLGSPTGRAVTEGD